MKRLRPRVALLDTIALILLFAAAVIMDTGGWSWRAATRRYSFQDPWRPFLAFGAVLLIRFWLHGLVGPFGRPWDTLVRQLGAKEDLSQAPPASGPSLREVVLVLAALAMTTAILCHNQVESFYFVPDMGDPLFSMWRVAWVTHQIVADPAHLFDANIFYPARATLAFSDSIILPSLTVAPLLWAGVHPAIAYTLLLLSGFVLSGLAVYVLARGLGLGIGASWIGALLFGFYPYRFDHYSHLELQMAHWAPIALLGVHRVLATGRLRHVALLAAAVAAQWYSSMYYGLFLMVYASTFAAVVAMAWRPGWRRVALAGLGLVVGVSLAFPLARVYSASSPSRGTRPIDVIKELSATPSDYLQPTHRSALYRSVAFKPRQPERELFPGVLPIALAIAGVVPPLSAVRLAVFAAGVVAYDGSLGLNGHWYPLAHDWLSPIRSMRVPARFAIFVGLTLALLSAFGVQRMLRSFRPRVARGLIVGVLTICAMLDMWPYLRLRPLWKNPPSLYASLGPSSGAVLFEYPFHPNPDWFAENLPYMYFSIWHWTKMVNGYSGFTPKSYWDTALETAGFPGGRTVDYLKGVGVTHVTLHCALWDERACAITIAALDADPRFRLLVRTRWSGADSLLYELRR